MSNPVLPVIKRGAGIFVHNSLAYYFDQSGGGVSVSRATEQVTDDHFGRLGETSHGTPVGEVSLTPTGMIRSLAKLYPYGPAIIEGVTRGWYAGQSIFNGTGYFHMKNGDKALYARAGVYKSPTLMLSSRKQVFGGMSFRFINKIDVPPTDGAVLKTVSNASFTDVTFDESLIVKDNYTATLGARSTPFDAMGAREGFELEATYGLTEVPDDGVGVADILVDSVAWRCKFAPNNLTEAQLDELCSWQGTNAIVAGQDVTFLDEDLIIDGGPLTVTMHKVGVVKAENGYGVKKDRNGNIELVNRMTFTAGVPDPLITMAINI